MKRRDGRFVIVGLLVFLCRAGGLRAQPLPVPEDLQVRVNQAIDAGTNFLKETQLPTGSWTEKGHEVGYAALPGLTLLECGVSPVDPLVQRSAQFIRWKAAKLDGTYELALSILFLDRLGDPQDRFLIQVLAMRLVAGQTATGGWGYKCPILPVPVHNELLTLLKKLGPPPLFDPLGRDAPLMARLPFRPALKNALLQNPLARPGDKSGELRHPLAGAGGAASPSTGGPSSTGSTQPALAGPGFDLPQAKGGNTASVPGAPSRKGWCIKMLEGPTRSVAPDKPPASAVKQKPIKIPPHLSGVAVLYDPAVLPVVDPDKKDSVWGKTDNSNSQFAMLALWAARRHGIPMTRTLNLISRRFQTSQNEAGGWGYEYKFGGSTGSAAMNSVGLLGLAISHGLAVEHGAKNGRVDKAEIDPRIVLGFLALDPSIGHPAGRWRDLPMTNLYFLWSVERLAVLFDLPTIGKKDWYRWGAEILVANQKAEGHWAHKGGYPGAHPTVDTSLALLFLKRANLARDLAARLPFNPRDLSRAIIANLPAPLERTPDEPPKSAAKLQPTQADVKLAFPLLARGIAKDNTLLPSSPSQPTAPAVSPALPVEMERSSYLWAWMVAVLGLLLLFAGTLFMLLGRNKEMQDDDGLDREGPGSRRRKASSR